MIVNKVSEVMGRRRMNVSELARRAGIGRMTAHRIYHGATDTSLEVVNKLCEVLQVDVCELYQWVPDAEASGTSAPTATERRDRDLAGAGSV